MSAPIIYDGDFTVAMPVGPLTVERPFQGDPRALIYRRPYWQLADYYEPLAISSPLDSHPGHYLVEESAQRAIGAGIVEWYRVWASIPSSRDEMESYVYSIPPVRGSTGNIQEIPVDLGVLESTNSTISVPAEATITNASIQFGVSMAVGKGTYVQATQWELPSWVAPNNNGTTDIAINLVPQGGGVYGIEVDPVSLARSRALGFRTGATGRLRYSVDYPELPAQPVSCLSRVRYDYFLPGVTAGVKTLNDIHLYPAFFVKSSDGSGKLGTTGSTPSIAEWNAWANTNGEVTAESSVARRWMGEIYERRTRYVRVPGVRY